MHSGQNRLATCRILALGSHYCRWLAFELWLRTFLSSSSWVLILNIFQLERDLHFQCRNCLAQVLCWSKQEVFHQFCWSLSHNLFCTWTRNRTLSHWWWKLRGKFLGQVFSIFICLLREASWSGNRLTLKGWSYANSFRVQDFCWFWLWPRVL